MKIGFLDTAIIAATAWGCLQKIGIYGLSAAVLPCAKYVGCIILGYTFLKFLSQPWGLNLDRRFKRKGISNHTTETIAGMLTHDIENMQKNINKGILGYLNRTFYDSEIRNELLTISLAEPKKQEEIMVSKNMEGLTPVDLLVEMNHQGSLQALSKNIFSAPLSLLAEEISEALPQQFSRDLRTIVAEYSLPSRYDPYYTTEKSKTWLLDILRDGVRDIPNKDSDVRKDKEAIMRAKGFLEASSDKKDAQERAASVQKETARKSAAYYRKTHKKRKY